MVGAGAVLACSTIAFAIIQRDRLSAVRWVNHTLEVLVQIEEVRNDLYEILLAQKDVELLGIDNYTKVSSDRFKEFVGDLSELKQIVVDNPSQRDRLGSINTSQLPTAERIRQIQVILEQAAQEERALLRDRSKWRDKAHALLSAASVATGFSFLLTLAVVAQLKQRELDQDAKQIRTIADLIHDLRNPVTRLSLDIQLLEREARLPVVTNRVRKILGICDFIIELLEDVRFLSQKDIVPEIVSVNIRTFAQELTNKANSVHCSTVSCYRVVCEFSTSCDTENFPLDAALIQRVLFNLLSNAIVYSPEDALVNFTATLHESTLLFAVADRGIGIPESDRAKLFEPFKRGSNVGGKQGTGLGLAIAHQIVKACGGQIWFESRLPESGTIFFVQLKK